MRGLPSKARKKSPRKRASVSSDEVAMRVMAHVSKRARALRDEIVKELEREGVEVVKPGSVEIHFEPVLGMGSVEWCNWIVKERK